MSKISETEAADQMETLRMLGEAHAAMEEVRGYGLGDDEHDLPLQSQPGQRLIQ